MDARTGKPLSHVRTDSQQLAEEEEDFSGYGFYGSLDAVRAPFLLNPPSQLKLTPVVALFSGFRRKGFVAPAKGQRHEGEDLPWDEDSNCRVVICFAVLPFRCCWGFKDEERALFVLLSFFVFEIPSTATLFTFLSLVLLSLQLSAFPCFYIFYCPQHLTERRSEREQSNPLKISNEKQKVTKTCLTTANQSPSPP